VAVGIGNREGDQAASRKDAPARHHTLEVASALEAEALLHDPAPGRPPLLGRKPGAALSAPVLNDTPATRRIHPPEEAVDTPPVAFLGLVRALDS
jgi:hypothetical protein